MGDDLFKQREFPYLNEEQLRKETFKRVFPPADTAPHATGGAIDLAIAGLDMGTGYAEFSELMYTNAKGLSMKQRQNRKLLIDAMEKSGFANYPGEWWHFSYGDREWVAYKGLRIPAIYGRATPRH